MFNVEILTVLGTILLAASGVSFLRSKWIEGTLLATGAVFLLVGFFVSRHEKNVRLETSPATVAPHATAESTNTTKPVLAPSLGIIESPQTPTPLSTPPPAKPLLSPQPTQMPTVAANRRAAPKLSVRQMAEMLTSWNRSRADTEKALEGLEIDEVLLFQSAERMRTVDEMVVSLSPNPGGFSSPLVVLRIPVQGNEHLPLTPQTQHFRVRGTVQKVNNIMIELRDGATFEPVAERP